MSEEQQEPRGSGQPLAVLAAVALLSIPLYVLSVGPAMWLIDSGLVDQRYRVVFAVVYAPLEYLYDHVHIVKVFFDAYLSLFVNR
jgi:hypothetical protein